MISKTQIKNIKLLHQKKYRESEGVFIAEGPKIVNDLLNSKFKVREVFATKEFKVQGSSLRIHEVTEKELIQLSALATPNQVIASFETEDVMPDVRILKMELVLALDDIRDPGNLGTIIRIADWFGIRHILCSESSVDVYNPKVIQATMGSIARVNVYYADLDTVLKEFNTVYAAVLDGDNIYSQKLSKQGVVLIGNESKGVSEKLMKCVNRRISIPNFSAGAESLNAAVAVAVICSEFKRREKA
ncbi:MAG: RNA methyltransferase [Bacteroidetes bacterium]|nr:MAG: RNA methyltransferase [Bacteroidota bacterium]